MITGRWQNEQAFWPAKIIRFLDRIEKIDKIDKSGASDLGNPDGGTNIPARFKS